MLFFIKCQHIDVSFSCLFIEEETNDALFYDPSMDDDDEAWVKRQRASYRPSPNKPGGASASAAGAKTKDTKSDAVLNCPACMCAVCLDCQRYDVHMHIIIRPIIPSSPQNQ